MGDRAEPTKSWYDEAMKAVAERAALVTENSRLRAALEAIRDHADHRDGIMPADCLEVVNEVARAALASARPAKE